VACHVLDQVAAHRCDRGKQLAPIPDRACPGSFRSPAVSGVDHFSRLRSQVAKFTLSPSIGVRPPRDAGAAKLNPLSAKKCEACHTAIIFFAPCYRPGSCCAFFSDSLAKNDGSSRAGREQWLQNAIDLPVTAREAFWAAMARAYTVPAPRLDRPGCSRPYNVGLGCAP